MIGHFEWFSRTPSKTFNRPTEPPKVTFMIFQGLLGQVDPVGLLLDHVQTKVGRLHTLINTSKLNKLIFRIQEWLGL